MGRKKPEDLTGRTFGLLKVIGKGDPMIMKNGVERTQWRCQCHCENIIDIEGGVLVREQRTDCGCVDDERFIGKWAYDLFVIQRIGKNHPEYEKGYKKYLCKCRCGVKKVVRAEHLKDETTKSCGCFNSKSKITHGKCYDKVYSIWNNVIQRCTNINDTTYPKYGAKGITVCDRWQGADGFSNFYADMGDPPSDKHSIDRYPDQKGNYSPDNCRWATPQQQSRNRSSNHLITWRGETHLLVEWSEILGMDYHLLSDRIQRNKWDVERAFTTPHKKMPPRKKSA